MKSKMFILVMTCLFSFCLLNAQETPKSTPPAPSTAPAPPAPPIALPNPPIAPEAPTPPNKPDTTKIVIGDKQIMIIDNSEKKERRKKASWERDLERSMKEMKEDLEEAKQDLEESKAEIKESQKEMEQELKKEQEEHNENQSPGDKYKLKLKKGNSSHKAVDIDFVDFDFGVNLLNIGSSIPKQMEEDLKLKTWSSWTYTFTFLPTKIFLGTRHLYLLTGLGWRIGQFEFKEKIDFDPVKPLLYTKDDNLEKSQFVIHQLQIPLSIYWKSKRVKNWGDLGIGVGTYAGILIHQELETETAHPKRDIETNEDFGFEKFRYGLSARLDIGPLKLFANMDMNKLWKDNDIKNIETGIWLDF